MNKYILLTIILVLIAKNSMARRSRLDKQEMETLSLRRFSVREILEALSEKSYKKPNARFWRRNNVLRRSDFGSDSSSWDPYDDPFSNWNPFDDSFSSSNSWDGSKNWVTDSPSSKRSHGNSKSRYA